MADGEYIVLRRDRSFRDRRDRLGHSPGGWTLDPEELAAHPPKWATERMGEREAEELKFDPDVLTSSLSVPVELIKALT